MPLARCQLHTTGCLLSHARKLLKRLLPRPPHRAALQCIGGRPWTLTTALPVLQSHPAASAGRRAPGGGAPPDLPGCLVRHRAGRRLRGRNLHILPLILHSHPQHGVLEGKQWVVDWAWQSVAGTWTVGRASCTAAHVQHAPPLADATAPCFLQWGLVWFFTQTIMALAMPYVLAVLPVQAYR